MLTRPAQRPANPPTTRCPRRRHVSAQKRPRGRHIYAQGVGRSRDTKVPAGFGGAGGIVRQVRPVESEYLNVRHVLCCPILHLVWRLGSQARRLRSFGKDYVRSRVSRADETHRLQRHLSNVQKNRILVYPTYSQPNIHAMHRKPISISHLHRASM